MAAGLSHAYNLRKRPQVPRLSRSLFTWICPSFFLLSVLSRVAMGSHAVTCGKKIQRRMHEKGKIIVGWERVSVVVVFLALNVPCDGRTH